MLVSLLPRITDENILRQEIIGSKKIIEAKINLPISAFAYPFGEYNDRSVNLVIQAGFKSARGGCVDAYNNPTRSSSRCAVSL